jgi:enoyl-CoA hydratase/carnithine racemase
MSRPLQVEREGAAWTFTLSRPDKRNALSAELVEALLEGIDEAHRSGARLMVFRGEGRNFSAGFDFSGIETQSEGDLLLRLVRIESLLQSVVASPCLTVALAHGRNFGAGVDLVAACRRRIGAPDATFRMPGMKFGLILGTRRFADIVGSARAGAILQEASSFDAAEAHAMGFLDEVIEAAQWPQALSAAGAAASALDDRTRAVLYDVLRSDHGDADLAALVRSAARPGLKARIAAYLDAS